MSFATEVVRFHSMYSKLSIEERNTPQILESVGKIKQLIEDSLSTELFAALSYGIRIGKAAQDPTWVQKIVGRAKDLSANLSEIDSDYLEPIFEKYLPNPTL